MGNCSSTAPFKRNKRGIHSNKELEKKTERSKLYKLRSRGEKEDMEMIEKILFSSYEGEPLFNLYKAQQSCDGKGKGLINVLGMMLKKSDRMVMMVTMDISP